MLTKLKKPSHDPRHSSLLILHEQMASVADLLGAEFPRPFIACTNFDHLLEMLERGSAEEILLELRREEPAALDCLCLLHRLQHPVTVHLVASSVPTRESWRMPPWMRLYERCEPAVVVREELIRSSGGKPPGITPLEVGDILTLVEAGRFSLHTRLSLEGRCELELVTHRGEIWSALSGDVLGSEALIDTLFDSVASSHSRQQNGTPESRWVFEDAESLFQAAELESTRSNGTPRVESRRAKVVSISRAPRGQEVGEDTTAGQDLPSEELPAADAAPEEGKVDSQPSFIDEALGRAMDIQGAEGAAVADYEIGLCLGARCRIPGFAMDRLAEENTELVRAKLRMLRRRNVEDEIEDLVISLGRTYHLMILIAGQTLLLYITLDRAGTNLALARFQAQALAKMLKA